MGKVIEINSKQEFEAGIKEGIVLVDFFAVWCGPCQMMKPVLEKLSKELDDVKVLAVDVDKFNDLASKYEVMSIPTFVIFKDGEPKEVKFGAMSEGDFKSWIVKNK